MSYTPPFVKRMTRKFPEVQETPEPKNVEEMLKSIASPPASSPKAPPIAPPPEPKVKEEKKEILWDRRMTKRELVDIAKDSYGIELIMTMAKSEMIEALEAADELK